MIQVARAVIGGILKSDFGDRAAHRVQFGMSDIFLIAGVFNRGRTHAYHAHMQCAHAADTDTIFYDIFAVYLGNLSFKK